jgi:hypothetical protein
MKCYRVERCGSLPAHGFGVEASPSEPHHYDVVLGNSLNVDA